MCRRPKPDEQIGKGRQHIPAAKPSRYRQGQALSAGLIDDRQDAELTAIMRAPPSTKS